MKRIPLLCLLASLLLAACTETPSENPNPEPTAPTAPNIILLIGDGMGLSQVSSAYYFGDEEPNFSRFKHIGLMKTSSASHKITDSAAGATAFSAGIKTYNGAIAVDTAKRPVPTVLENLAEKGWKTGVIATSSITHATPASFYAHVESRQMAETIASQMVDSPVDFFAGGGRQFFCKRSDSLNLLPQLAEKGFVIDTNALNEKISDPSRRYGYLLADDGMMPKPMGRGNFLPAATDLGLAYLDAQEDPFFLMVEGSQIDWGGHANNGEYIIEEVLDFDVVIGNALDYAEKDGNTLVIVTADHETGGFTLAGEVKKNDQGKEYDDYNSVATTFSTGGHSTTLIPVFAWGPGSEAFQGIYENTRIYDLMMEMAGEKAEAVN